MNETSAARAAARWPLAAAGETDWLRELTDDDGLTGFMPPALPDAAWVLHSMYEHELGPTDMSFTAYERAVLNGGGPEIVPGLDPADVFTGTVGEHPGPRWRRLRWAELSRRTGDPVAPEGRLPCHRSFPSLRESGGWPVGISGPSEGRLDRADWNRLVDILTEHSAQGPDTRCLAYYNPLLQGAEEFDDLHVRAGTLADAKALYDHPGEELEPRPTSGPRTAPGSSARTTTSGPPRWPAPHRSSRRSSTTSRSRRYDCPGPRDPAGRQVNRMTTARPSPKSGASVLSSGGAQEPVGTSRTVSPRWTRRNFGCRARTTTCVWPTCCR